MRLDELERMLEASEGRWRFTANPTIVYCCQCRWRGKATSTCQLSMLSVGPHDYCSKGEAVK